MDPSQTKEFHHPQGFLSLAKNVGIKDSTLDLTVIYSTVRARAAAMFRRNRFSGAAKVGLHPVLIRNSSRHNGSELLREAREWQGDTISTLAEIRRLAE